MPERVEVRGSGCALCRDYRSQPYQGSRPYAPYSPAYSGQHASGPYGSPPLPHGGYGGGPQHSPHAQQNGGGMPYEGWHDHDAMPRHPYD